MLKKLIEELIEQRKTLFQVSGDKQIPVNKIGLAEALTLPTGEKESDEDFAKRLQEAELRRVGIF